jgi:hypothetical protein
MLQLPYRLVRHRRQATDFLATSNATDNYESEPMQSGVQLKYSYSYTCFTTPPPTDLPRKRRRQSNLGHGGQNRYVDHTVTTITKDMKLPVK